MSTLLIIGLKNAILVIPLALLALGIGRWSRRPALSHLLWTLVLVKLLTPPLIHVPVGWQLNIGSWLDTGRNATQLAETTGVQSSNGVRNATARNVVRPSRGLSSRSTVAKSSRPVPQVALTDASIWSWSRIWSFRVEILAGIWLVGSGYVLTKLVWRSIQFHRFLQIVERRHESLGPRAAELALRARIRIAPRVIVVDSVVSPMLWGMGRRACLVFPARLVSRLSPAELDALLLHELAHFARGDHWVRVLELISSVLYWWHPVFWWTRHELEIAEEQCCDAWVIEHQNGGRISYAEALLATIDFLHDPATSRPPVACGLGDVPFLRTRLIQIMRGQVAARLPRTVTAVVLIAGLICSPLEPAVWAKATSGGRSLFDFTRRRPQATDAAVRRDSGLASNKSTRGSLREQGTRLLPAAADTLTMRTPASAPNIIRPQSRPLGVVWATAHSPDGKYRLDARVGHRMTLISAVSGFSLDMSSHQISCQSFSPDSRTFMTGHDDAIVRRWDSETGGMLQSYKGSDSPITSLHISPDGKLVAVGTRSGNIIVWDIETGDEVARHQISNHEVSCLRWSPSGDRLAISTGDWSRREGIQLVVWSLQNEAIQFNQSLSQPVGALEWVEPLDALVVAGWDGYALPVILESGEFGVPLQIEKGLVSAAAWSGNCRLIDGQFDALTLLGANR